MPDPCWLRTSEISYSKENLSRNWLIPEGIQQNSLPFFIPGRKCQLKHSLEVNSILVHPPSWGLWLQAWSAMAQWGHVRVSNWLVHRDWSFSMEEGGGGGGVEGWCKWGEGYSFPCTSKEEGHQKWCQEFWGMLSKKIAAANPPPSPFLNHWWIPFLWRL